MCAEVGIEYVLHSLPDGAGFDEVAGRVLLLNADEDVSAIMLHMPLPEEVDTELVQSLIDPDKDVEGVILPTSAMLCMGGAVSCRVPRLRSWK